MTDTEKKIAEIRFVIDNYPENDLKPEFSEQEVKAFELLGRNKIEWLRFLLSELDRIQQEYAEERAAHNAHVAELCELEKENRKLREERDDAREQAQKYYRKFEDEVAEILRIQDEIEWLQQERAELIEVLRIVTDVLGTVPMNDARLWGVYNKLCNILKEIGVTVE